MTGYYDYVLMTIPLALFGITAALTFTGLSVTTAVPAGASVSMAVIGHAMFVRAPVDDLPEAEVESQGSAQGFSQQAD